MHIISQLMFLPVKLGIWFKTGVYQAIVEMQLLGVVSHMRYLNNAKGC